MIILKQKRIYLIFYLALLTVYSSAQDSVTLHTPLIDSLLAAIPQSKDTQHTKALNFLARQYINYGEYKEGIRLSDEALQEAEKYGYYRGVAVAHNNIGIVYCNTGEYEKAIEHYLLALKSWEKIKDSLGMANIYGNIGIVYFVQENFKPAIENATIALNIRRLKKDESGIGMSLNNLALIYSKQKEYDRALENYMSAIEIFANQRDTVSLDVSYNNISNIYTLKKEYIKALTFQMKALHLSEESDDKQRQAFSYFNIGKLYTDLNHFNEAKTYLDKALTIDFAFGNKDAVKEEYLAFSRLFEKSGDYLQAYNYHKKYVEIKDTLLNEESSLQISEMTTKYETEKKEKDIQLLTKDKELQGVEISRQKFIRNGVIIGLLVTLILVLVLNNRFKLTRKQKKIIERQNEQIFESINYSKKIQDSLLPSVETMQKYFASVFIYYQPKDIVSGDFYFFKEFKKFALLACVDCTGHGVPGGFMSTLGSLLLDRIAISERLKPSEMLTQLSDEIIRVLHQEKGGVLQDGMDLSICLIDKSTGIVEYSGARNGIILVSNGVPVRFKASAFPVGGNYEKKGKAIDRHFETQKIEMKQGDYIYMYTDGYFEQIGGAENLPMNNNQFIDILVNTEKEAFENKITYLKSHFDAWKAANPQTDDVLVIGFQLL